MGLGNLLLIPGLGAAPLDIRAKVGVSSSPTSTGNQAITGVGFQPKAVLPFGVGLPVGMSTTNQAPFGFGVGVSTSNRASVGVGSQSGVTTSATERSHNNADVFDVCDPTQVDSFLRADLAAIGSDGFTLGWERVEATARVLNHICLGGADLEVSLTQHQLNGTNAPQSFAHGLSGTPTGIISFSIGIDVAPAVTTTTAVCHLGLWANGQQYLTSVLAMNGFLTTQTRRTLVNNRCLTAGLNSDGSYARSLSIDSVDASNVNCTYQDTAGAGQRFFWMLAIRGAKCQTGTFKYGTLSPFAINCAGITPKLFLPVFTTNGVDNINTVQNRATLAIGAYDGASTASAGILDVDAQTTTNTRRWQSSTSLAEYDSGGALGSEASVAFRGQSVVVTPTTLSNPGYGQGAYLIIGA